MRVICSLLFIAFLSACGAASGPPVVSSDNNLAQHLALPPSLGIGVRDQRAPNAKLAIHSIGIIATINGKSEKGYIPARCSVTDKGGVAHGCSIVAKQNLHIKKIVAGLFTKAAAQGCLVADGRWHGYVPTGSAIPIVFYWTGNC